jgi:hypothetical protein
MVILSHKPLAARSPLHRDGIAAPP